MKFCPQPDRRRGIVILLIVTALWLINFMIIKSSGKDIMNVNAFETDVFQCPFGEKCCSYWVVSHFIMYVFLGYYAPNCWVAWIILGVVWECLEWCVGKFKPQKGPTVPGTEYGDSNGNGWCQGSYKDIVFNLAGLLFGMTMNSMFRSVTSS